MVGYLLLGLMLSMLDGHTAVLAPPVIGMHVSAEHLAEGAGLGAVLLLAALAGKFMGPATPALLTTGVAGATLLGMGMIPRAEIALVVLDRGPQLGEGTLPDEVCSAMVFVSLVTCVGAPYTLNRLLRRWPQTESPSS